ncbi:hypothetical protein GCM10009000_077750 [Halobacterium noricense]|uniref:Uncharacterized protein n=1 Tax=Haladaptatus pallidirubidus TaxID=1008152 RepID=A0AAV3UPJ3_9EURY
MHYTGRDPVELIETYGDRMSLIYMKDSDAERNEGFREIGERDGDIPGCAEAAR